MISTTNRLETVVKNALKMLEFNASGIENKLFSNVCGVLNEALHQTLKVAEDKICRYSCKGFHFILSIRGNMLVSFLSSVPYRNWHSTKVLLKRASLFSKFCRIEHKINNMTSLIIFERFKIKICGTYCDDGCDIGFPLQVLAQLRRCHQFENFTNPGYDKSFNDLFEVSLNRTKISYSTNIY